MSKDELIALIKDDRPIDRHGTTKIIALAETIKNGSKKMRQQYQKLAEEIIPDIPDSVYPFIVKFDSFCEIAGFDKTLYAQMADFIINYFPEPDDIFSDKSKSQVFLRGFWISWLASVHPDLLAITWIEQTSKKFQELFPWHFLQIKFDYDINTALAHLEKLLESINCFCRRDQAFNALIPVALKLKQKPDINNYLEHITRWLPLNQRADFRRQMTLIINGAKSPEELEQLEAEQKKHFINISPQTCPAPC